MEMLITLDYVGHALYNIINIPYTTRVLVIPSVALFVVGLAMINAIDGIAGGLVPRGARAGQCLLHPCITKDADDL